MGAKFLGEITLTALLLTSTLPLPQRHAPTGTVVWHLFGCGSTSKHPTFYIQNEPGGFKTVVRPAQLDPGVFSLKVDAGHHYVQVVASGCGAFAGIQVFAGAAQERSLGMLRGGYRPPLDPWDVSLAGKIPDAAIAGVELEVEGHDYLPDRAIIDKGYYDFEMIEPGHYRVVVTFSNHRHRVVAHLALGLSKTKHNLLDIANTDLR